MPSERLVYLIRKAMKYGCENPEEIYEYLVQQGFERTSYEEIQEIMNAIDDSFSG